MNGWWPLAMFLVAFFFIFSGYPVALALGGTALIFAFLGHLAGIMDWNLLFAIPERIFGIMGNSILLAVPFFIYMGAMLEKSKLAEDLLKTMGALFGPLRGGLGISVVVVGALLAAATGVVGASVVAMGMISLPVMLRYGYSKEIACGLITASGTLGQIIPPSVVLLVLADQMGVSVGDLFHGALYPGIILAGLYILYAIMMAIWKPESMPALPAEDQTPFGWPLFKRVCLAMLPPLILVLVVLGSIFWGIATPTEAGALGAVGAMILAAMKKTLNRKSLTSTMDSTTRLTAMVMFLLIGSTAFALVFRGLNGDIWIEQHLTSLPGGKWGLLIIANIVIFILGFFIDFFEIAFIIVPLLVPAARILGIDLVWLGVVIGLNLQTSFLTPPFGFALFYLRGVAPEEVKTSQIYRGVLPFIVIQVIALSLVFIFPKLVHY